MESDDDAVLNAWRLGFADGREHERADSQRIAEAAPRSGEGASGASSSVDTTLVQDSQSDPPV